MNNIAMQNRPSEKIPKAMIRMMFAFVVFILIAVSFARENGRISFYDPSTAWQADLMGFGADNSRAFAMLLAKAKKGE